MMADKIFIAVASETASSAGGTVLQVFFWICAVLSILSMITAVILFFRFQILQLFKEVMGSAKRKGIRQLQEANAVSSKLSKDKESPKAGKGQKKPEIKETKPVQTAAEQEKQPIESPKKETDGMTAPIRDDGSQGTRLLKEEPKVKIGRFQIVSNIKMIHTEETIPVNEFGGYDYEHAVL